MENSLANNDMHLCHNMGVNYPLLLQASKFDKETSCSVGFPLFGFSNWNKIRLTEDKWSLSGGRSFEGLL